MNRRHLSTSPFQPKPVAPVEEYSVGDRVIHDTYGLGAVTALEGRAAVRVDFGPRLERVPLPCKKMTLF